MAESTDASWENDAGLAAARTFMFEQDIEPNHALQVYTNSMLLFDVTTSLHGLGNKERRLLAAAALLHDIGFSVGETGHHKHSRDLILGGNLKGFSQDELRIVACVARYHRKAHPKPTHQVFSGLNASDQELVQRLAALIRIADGLDRCHDANTEGLRLLRDGVNATLLVKQRCPNPTDIWGAMRKRRLFEEVFGADLDIIAEDA